MSYTVIDLFSIVVTKYIGKKWKVANCMIIAFATKLGMARLFFFFFRARAADLLIRTMTNQHVMRHATVSHTAVSLVTTAHEQPASVSIMRDYKNS